MKTGEIILDTTTVHLYGKEDRKSDLIISSIISGIRAGDIFEAIEVQQFSQSPDSYLLLGAHHRAIAHYIEGVQLRCKLVMPNKNEHPEIRQYCREHPEGIRKYIHIRDVVIIDDKAAGHDGLGLLENKRDDDHFYRKPRIKIPHMNVFEARTIIQKRKKSQKT